MTAPSLPEFILAREGEMRAAAEEVASRGERHGRKPEDFGQYLVDQVIGPFGGQSALRDVATGLYMARVGDPARVLRQCDAIRALIEEAASQAEEVDGEWGCGHSASDITTETERCRHHSFNASGVRVESSWLAEHDPEFGDRDPIRPHCKGVETFRALVTPFASIWSDHEDFREEWAV